MGKHPPPKSKTDATLGDRYYLGWWFPAYGSKTDVTMGEYNPEKLYIVAVGCKHTGYKALMAGLVTEWIYDAFAGKLTYICINFTGLTNSMNSPTSC